MCQSVFPTTQDRVKFFSASLRQFSKCRTKIVVLIPILVYVVYRLFASPADILFEVRLKSKPSQPNNSFKHTVKLLSSYGNSRYITNQNHMFNCSTIDRVILKRKLGEGVSKQGFLGEYNGITVVVKLSRSDLKEIPRCIKNLSPVGEVICPQYSRMKIMKEIITLEEITHPTIARLMGYCARGGLIQADGLTDRGFISVIEWGDDVTTSKLRSEHWFDRLKHAQDIAEIMLFLERSPIGSIAYPDFHVRHFKMFNNTIKMIDFDMVYNREPSCHPAKKCSLHIKCVEGKCNGHNAKANLKRMNKHFLSVLYRPSTYPEEIYPKIKKLHSDLTKLSISADELIEKLKVIRVESKHLK